ncbi:MAG: quinol:cytochrome C oxidoreductase [Planctomycetes bacterium]|nr:quinol:cytochrome C oxidoreductase [Planctomycetota bacterium]
MNEQTPMTANAVAPPGAGSGLKKTALTLIVVGGLLSLGTLLTDTHRFGFAYLWAFTFVWVLSMGGLFFVTLHHLSRAVWSVVFRRTAEMLTYPLYYILILFAPIALFVLFEDKFNLFPWADPGIVNGDHILEGKTLYLNTGFFILRGVVFLGLWWLFARFFLHRSLRQDQGLAGEEATNAMRRGSGPLMILFALTVTFASFDWLMSLEPHWFSTLFGVYIFGGIVLSGLSALILAVMGLKTRGLLGRNLITRDHLYSLGALLFAFTCFWGYIAFSQFMLIWYGNIPEETIYFAHRGGHGWLAVSLILVAIRFVLPFFLLLSRGSKMNARRLVLVAVIGLLGQLVDLYWLIMPRFFTEGPSLSWQEFGPLLLLSGVLLILMSRFLGRYPTLAAKDPYYEKSCAFHL